MNRGLKSYGILLVLITTLVFTLTDFGVVNATTSTDQNPSTQSSGLPDLNPDSGDKNPCDDCNNNNNDDNSNNNNDDNSNNNNDDSSTSSTNANSNNNNDDSSTSSTNANSNNNEKENINNDVPMSLPFNSNVGGESDDKEKDFSSVIPFP
jgi:hypothetical protein